MNINDIYYISIHGTSILISPLQKQHIYLNEDQSNLFTSLPIMQFGYIRFENCKDLIYRYNEQIYILFTKTKVVFSTK